MGQRLNIEIVKKNKTLANSYYHWSGYTSSAMALTYVILNETELLKNIKNGKIKEAKLNAIRVLERTGAKLPKEEITVARRRYPNEVFDNESINRNDGLLSISKSGIEQNRLWEEARVTIDVTNENINFDVMYRVDEEYYDDDDDSCGLIDNFVELTYNPHCISFDDWIDFTKQVSSVGNGRMYNKTEGLLGLIE